MIVRAEREKCCDDELIYQGTGGIVSNVHDIWKFHVGLNGDRLLSETSKKELFDTRGISGDYALGWSVAESDPLTRPVGRIRKGERDSRWHSHVQIEWYYYKELKAMFVGLCCPRSVEQMAR